jgi:hypothetical protein
MIRHATIIAATMRLEPDTIKIGMIVKPDISRTKRMKLIMNRVERAGAGLNGVFRG